MANSSTIPLGMYVGNADGNDASAEASFETAASSFADTFGESAQYNDVFIDYTKPVSEWLSNSNWAAWSNASSSVTQSTTPVIALPMASTTAGAASADATYKAYASGAYDSMLWQMVAGWKANGYSTQVWRPGWEMNLTTSPSYATANAQTQADWVAAFRHIYTVLHQAAAADGVNLQVAWNPSATSWAPVNAIDTLYPGNSYVDMIGADVYGDAYPYSLYDFASNGTKTNTTMAQWLASPANQDQYWTDPASNQWSDNAHYPSALSLQNLIDFAKAQGKPLVIPETGAGNSNSGTDTKDDSAFPKWLATTLQAAQADGVQVKFVNVWDSNGGGNYAFSASGDGKPAEATAWATYFGGTAPTNQSTSSTSSIPPASSTTAPATTSASTGAATTTSTSSVTRASMFTFMDTQDSDLSQSVISSGSQATYAGTLTGNVFQWVDGGENWASTSSFAQNVVTAKITDTTGRSFGLSSFQTVDATLSGATNGLLTVQQAAGGTINLGNGNYEADITVLANAGAGDDVNNFDLTLGSGTQAVNVDASSGWGHTSINATTTAGTHTLNFVYPGAVDFTNDGGTDTVSVTGGVNQFHSGSGALNVTENGIGVNAYDFGSAAGNLTIAGFSTDQGDTLSVSSALEARATITGDGQGGTLIGFGSNVGKIDLIGVQQFSKSGILWA